jgi:hypothetical protein
MNEIKLYKSPRRALKLLFLSSIFVFVGIWLITSTDSPKLVGWLSICFFSLGYPVGLFHLFDRRPQIIINEIGIWDRTTKQEMINWEIILNAYLTDINGQKFICLVVNESYEPSTKKGGWYKNVGKLNKSLGFQELNISLGQIKINEIKLTEFIIEMSKADTTKKAELIKILPHI